MEKYTRSGKILLEYMQNGTLFTLILLGGRLEEYYARNLGL